MENQPDINQPAVQAAPHRKIYRGQPENQRDPTAVNQPFPKRSSGKQQQKKSVPASLPKPSLKEKNVGGSVSTGNPADATLFSSGIAVRETNPHQTFSPGAPALPDITATMYSELLADDPNLAKVLLPEYVQYYSTAMLWCRIVTLKDRNAQSLTRHEQDLLMAIQETSFAIPEPLMLQLRALGNITTDTKENLYPAFPQLPIAVIQNIGGHYGTLLPPGVDVNNSLHNLYEEIPCLGVMAYAVCVAISNQPPGNYQSILTYNNQQPTRNLLGFRPLCHRRNEAKNLAIEVGITDVEFPSYPVNTSFNFDFLAAISNALAGTKTFKIHNVNFGSIPEVGAQSQIVITRPIVENQAGPAVRGELRPTCLIKEKESIFGSGVFFASQLMKVVGGNNASWKLFQNIPQAWRDNANERRDLPAPYLTETFQSVSQQASGFRSNVIKTMVLTKR